MKKFTLLILAALFAAVGWAQLLNEGFEGTYPPAEWGTYANAYTKSATYAAEGTYSINTVASSTYKTYGLVTPVLIGGGELKFKLRTNSYYGSASWYTTVRVKVSTTNDQQASFTTVKEFSTYSYSDAPGIHSNNVILTSTQLTSWYQCVVDLSAYAAQNIYVALEVYDHNGCDFFIDDVQGPALFVPSCPKPKNLKAVEGSVTSSSAIITWTAGKNETEWLLQYQKEGETAITSVTVSDTPEHPLTGLEPNTKYFLKVKAICGEEDESDEVLGDPFTTKCLPTALPFADDFYYWTTGSTYFDSCWEKYKGANASTYPYVVATNNQSLQFNQSTTTISAAFLPELTATGDLALSFDLNMVAANRMVVVVATDPQNPNTWVPIDTIKDGNGNYQSYERIIPNYLAGKRIGFKSFVGSGTSTTSAYLDNVVVTNCARPTDLALDSATLTATSVNLTFNGGTATQWQYAYAPSSVTDLATVRPVLISNNIIELSGLTKETAYKIWVRSYCDATHQSVWSAVLAFSTPPTCPRPTAFTRGVTTASSANFSWTKGKDETAWVFEYKKSSETEYTPVDVITNSYVLPVEPNTAYNVRVKASCSAVDESAWVSLANFTTPCMPCSLPYTEGFESYAGTSYDVAGPVPNCWYTHAQSGSTTLMPHVTGSGTYHYPHGGTKALTFTGGPSYGGTNTYAVLPLFDTPIDQLAISFWYRYENSTYGTLTIGYITGDQNNVASYVPLFTPTATSTVTQTTVYKFTDAPAGATYIAIRWYYDGSSYYSASIDDINVSQVLANDVAATAVTSPVTTGANLATANFTVTVKNNGTLRQTDVPVVLEVDGAVTTLLLDTINGGATKTVTFTGVNVSTPVTHTFAVRAYTNLATDQNRANDTTSVFSLTNQFIDPCIDGFRAGTGTTTQYYAPVYSSSSYAYNYTQTIYLASDMTATGGIAGAIASIAYNWNGTGNLTNANNWTIYIGQTTKTDFTGNTDWVPLANLQQVFSGIVTLPPTAGWMTIDLDVPFVWDGTSNIVVAVDENAAGNGNSSAYWYSTSASNRTIYYYHATTNPDPASPPTASGRGTSYPNMRFNVCPPTTCPKPKALAVVGAPTTFGAQLSWTVIGTENAWTLEYKKASDPESAYVPVSVTTPPPYTLSGVLEANTTYNARVKAVCVAGTNESYWSNIVDFRTACDATSLPFTEDFTGYTATQITNIPCWLLEGNRFDIANSVTGLTGNVLRFYGAASTAKPLIVRLPVFDVDVNTSKLSFKLRKENTTSSGVFGVGYLTNPMDTSTFVLVFDSILTTASTTPLNWEKPLSSFPAGIKNIAFRQKPNTDNYYYWIDDIKVEVIPTCPRPTALTVAANTTTSSGAVISWTEGGTETAWTLEYKKSSEAETEYTPVSITTPPPYPLNGLDANTAYDVRVKAVCVAGTDESGWSNVVNFTTALSCPKPTALTVAANTTTSSGAELLWTAGNTESAWTLEYKKASDPESEYIAVPVQTYPSNNLNGLLESNTAYNARVKAVCVAGTDESEWSPVFNFTTECDAYSLPFAENFTGWTTSSSYFDPCWKKYAGSDAYSYYPYVSASNGQSLYFYNSTTSNINAGFLPLLDADGLDLAIEFDVTMPSTGRVEVIAATDPQNKTTWTTLGGIISDGTSVYKHYKRSLPNYQAGTYIGFKYYSTSTLISAYIDNIVVYQTLANDVTVTSLTSSVGTEVINCDTAIKITVIVQNKGVETQEGIPVVLEVNGTVVSDKSIASLASGATATIVFEDIDISTLGTYVIRAYTALDIDENEDNNEMSITLVNGTACDIAVKIGDGTTTQSNVPVSSNWGHNYSQTIYLASEVAAAAGAGAGTLTSIAYHWNGAGNLTMTNNWTIYIGTTSKTSFEGSNATNLVPFADLEEVYSGIVTLPASAGWMNIPFDNTFDWDGQSNIVVAVFENISTYGTTASWYSTTASNRNIYYHIDGTTPIDLASLPTSLSGRESSYPNIKLKVCPSDCERPAVIVGTVTDVTANISWTGNSSSYVVEWGVRGFELGTSTPVTVTGNAYEITGLNPLTDYDVYVYGDCGIDGFSKTTRKQFTTDCWSAVVVTKANPYLEGLENAVINSATSAKMSGACWEISNEAGSSITLSFTQDDNSIDGKYAKVSKGAIGKTASLISPVFDISALAAPQLSMKHIEFGYYVVPDRAEEFRVYYKAAATDAWALVPGMEFTALADDWSKDTASLPNPSATYQLKFEVTGKNASGVGLDNIAIFEAPIVTTDSIYQEEATPENAILYGTVISGSKLISSQGFEYAINDVVNGTKEISEDGILTLLSTGARYEFRAFATTEDGTYYGDIMEFFTGTVPYEVTTLAATLVTDSAATLNNSVINGSETVLSRGFNYREVGATTWIEMSTAATSLSLTGLMPNTNYEFFYFVETDEDDILTPENEGMYVGATLTFTTLNTPPVIVTVAATDITYNSATLHKTLTKQGSEPIVSESFEYRAMGATTWIPSSDGLLTGLLEHQEYQFRAVVTIDYTVSKYTGEILTFTTLCPVRTGTATVEFCETGSVVYEGTTYTEAGEYPVTITLPSGCDSIVTLTVTMNSLLRATHTVNVCAGDSYSYHGSHTVGTNTVRFANATGCDSLVTLIVVEDPLLIGTLTVSVCSGSTYEYRGVDYPIAPARDVRFANATGCDSVVTLTVNALPTYNIPVSATICEGSGYLFDADGETYTEAGVYSVTLTTVNNCDSVVTLTLSVTSIDRTVTYEEESHVLTATQEDAEYQWYKGCDASKTKITGATEQSYTATENGFYSVEITYNDCVFVSDCSDEVKGLGIIDVFAGKVSLYPNPAKQTTTLVIDGLNTAAQIVITDLAGREAGRYNMSAAETQLNINVSDFADGTYLIRIITEKGNSIQKLVVKK